MVIFVTIYPIDNWQVAFQRQPEKLLQKLPSEFILNQQIQCPQLWPSPCHWCSESLIYFDCYSFTASSRWSWLDHLLIYDTFYLFVSLYYPIEKSLDTLMYPALLLNQLNCLLQIQQVTLLPYQEFIIIVVQRIGANVFMFIVKATNNLLSIVNIHLLFQLWKEWIVSRGKIYAMSLNIIIIIPFKKIHLNHINFLTVTACFVQRDKVNLLENCSFNSAP